MFCPHCEERIKHALSRLPEAEQVSVSYQQGTASFISADSVTFDVIRETIEGLDYEVLSMRELNQGSSWGNQSPKERLIEVSSVLVIILGLYVIAYRLGYLKILNAFPIVESSMNTSAVFFVGLATSLHCIGMCGGINLSQSLLIHDRSLVIRKNAQYHLGRILSYGFVGLLAGFLGSILQFSSRMKAFWMVLAGILMILVALNLLGVFRALTFRFPNSFRTLLQKRKKGTSSFVIGLLNGFMPCGPLQSMQLYALSTGSIWKGWVAMTAFGLGTVPLMFAFGTTAGTIQKRFYRQIVSVSAVLVFVMGIHSMGNGLSLLGIAKPSVNDPSLCTSIVKGEKQYVTTEIDYGSYPPISVTAGVEVEWTILAEEEKLNGCNREILIPEYDLSIPLSPGMNVVHFLPEAPGTYAYTCWMGMIQSSITVK